MSDRVFAGRRSREVGTDVMETDLGPLVHQ